VNEADDILSGMSLLPAPAVALDGPAAARLAAESGVLGAISRGDDLRQLARLATAVAASGAANVLVPRVVLPALLAPGAAVDGTTTIALGELDDDLDPSAPGCRLDDGVLDGAKPLVSAAGATSALVSATAREGVVLVEVDLRAHGVTVEAVSTIGRGGDADLRFDAVAIATDAIVADAARLSERLAAAAPTIALVQAAEGRGLLRRMLELAVEHGRERYAFGRPIGSFQAFQHACADMAMDLELTEALVDYAAAIPTLVHALEARVFVADAVVAGSRAALQLQGGGGFLDEHPVARLYRQAKESQLRWGGIDREHDAIWGHWIARADAEVTA
jgi:alkylation response protein AidB-like acyl-CoA dehydrogenase